MEWMCVCVCVQDRVPSRALCVFAHMFSQMRQAKACNIVDNKVTYNGKSLSDARYAFHKR